MMPTPSEFFTTTHRAAHLGLRVLIVCPGHPQGAPVHVEIIDADTRRTVATVQAWGEVGEWLDEVERIQGMRRAA